MPHGVGSSPVLVDDLVVVQVTHDGPSYYLAIDKRTGDQKWSFHGIERNNVPSVVVDEQLARS